MKTKLHILLLEDNLADAELIAQELEAADLSFSIARVETESEFRQQLRTKPDLVLSDHGLATFDGFRALAITREAALELPFIFVSGSNSQQMIVEMFELGATDYVFKRDIKDLKLAVKTALEPAQATELSAATLPPKPLPAAPAAPVRRPAIKPIIDQLLFCPQCHQAWDDSGNRVIIEDYCGHHIETVIYCHVCMECDALQNSTPEPVRI